MILPRINTGKLSTRNLCMATLVQNMVSESTKANVGHSFRMDLHMSSGVVQIISHVESQKADF